MKTTLTVLMVVVLALTAWVVYASEAETPLYNGITYFELTPSPDCTSVQGAGAGSLIPAAEFVPMNAVTYVDLEAPGARNIGRCAGSISEEKLPAMHNGITVF